MASNRRAAPSGAAAVRSVEMLSAGRSDRQISAADGGCDLRLYGGAGFIPAGAQQIGFVTITENGCAAHVADGGIDTTLKHLAAMRRAEIKICG